jgi:hypothetical protein
MSAVLTLLLTIVPMIPKLIEAGQATFDLYDKVKKVIDENRSPNQAEWDQLEAMIAEQQAIVRDTSKDVQA